MIKLSHDLNFLYETLLSILLTVSGLLGERLYRIVQMVVKFLDQIHRCEVAFPDFLDRFKLFMKSFLIHVYFQEFFPFELIFVWELQKENILLAVKFDGIFLDKESNFEQERNVSVPHNNHFGEYFCCYFLFGQWMDHLRGIKQPASVSERFRYLRSENLVS